MSPDRRLIINFRGTESQKDAATDMNAKLKKAHFLPRDFRQHMIKVHAGFLRQYDSCRQLIRDYALVKQWRHNYPEILVTGHRVRVRKRSFFALFKIFDTLANSLGGALSVLCALDLAVNPIAENGVKIKVITFGAPRTGNAGFCHLFNKLCAHHIRCVHRHDVVPKVPPELLSFKHVNNSVLLAEPEQDGGTGSGMNPLSAHSMLKYIQSAITSHQKLQIKRLERNELLEDVLQMALAFMPLILFLCSTKLLQ